jgi:hypothetical protein
MKIYIFVYFKIPSIASRLDILADIADQMEQNTNNNPQQLFLKYLIESIQKQQDRPIDFSTKITEQQSSLSIQNKHHPFVSYSSSSNGDFFKQVQDRISTNSIPLKKRYRSDTSSPDINRNDTYSERRKKNNEAAKRSRDTRRAKEDEIAIR